LKRELFLKGEIPKDGDEREAALTKAALRYASALATGYSDPKKVNSEVYTLKRPKVDAAAGLSKALADDRLTEWFASLAPQTDEYRLLSQEFARYAKLNGSQGSPEAGERARQIAVNLELLRWLDRDPPPTRIDVNTAAAFLEYRRDAALRDRRCVPRRRGSRDAPTTLRSG
jgi:murein L,D-transpeptidase YcbB/YkuD